MPNKFILVFLLFAARLYADTTYVSGHISTNTVWDTTNSPYIVTANLTVDSLATLKINPGVKIAIDTSVYIGIIGTLHAIGTPIDSIIFTSKQFPGWDGLVFASTAHCSLKYCRIEYATITGIDNYSDDFVYIGYSTISNNGSPLKIRLGVGINNTGHAIITNNTISDNSGNYCTGFGGIGNFGTAIITNNILSGNARFEAGAGIINYGGNITVIGNTMTMNNGGIYNNGTATIMNNNIISDGGNGSGGIVNNGPATITGNNISNNYSGGINNSYDSILIANNFIYNNNGSMWRKANDIENTGSFVTIKHNIIVDTGYYADSLLPSIYNSGSNVVICSTNIYSKYYAIKNDSTDSVDARYNFWNTTDTLVIDSKIWDFYDDSSKGIVYYKPFLSDTVGVQEQFNNQTLKFSNLNIIGNKIYLSTQNAITAELKLFDICGRLKEVIHSGILTRGAHTFIPNIKATGIYFVTLSTGGCKQTRKLILIK